MEPEENELSFLQLPSDKPLTKRQRTENSKSSRKKKKKLRIMYENEFKNNVLSNFRKDIDQNELELERLVFGGEDDILEQLDSDLPTFGKSYTQECNALEEGEADEANLSNSQQPELRTPAWKDEDDDKILVSEKADTLRNCHRSVSERGNEKYEDFVREKFLKITGAPAWADMEKDGNHSDSDDSSEEILRKTGDFIVQSSALPKGVIDIRKCQNLTNADAPSDIIKSAEFHPSSKVAVVAGYSGTATLYQVDGKSNPKIQSVHFDRFPIYTAHFTVDGNELVVGSKEFGYYYVYDMIKGKINRVPWEKGMEQYNVKKFHMSPDGKLMVIQGRYGNMHLVSSRTKEWIGSLKMNGEVVAITFSRDGSRMYSHGETGQVYVWDMSRRLCVHKFTDEGCITGTSISLSSNNQYLATGSDSGVVNIYETSSLHSSASPKPLKSIMNLTTEVTNLKFNCSSEILAMASSYKRNAVKLVHFPSMNVFSNFPIQEKKLGHIDSLDISLNSGYLLLGSNIGKVYLYRLRHYSNY